MTTPTTRNFTSDQDPGIIVRRYQIIGTTIEVMDAWEPLDGHSTITTINGRRYGQIGTRRLPREYANMERGEARIRQVRAFYDRQFEEAYNVIIRTNADALSGRFSDGQISVSRMTPRRRPKSRP